MAPRSDRKVSAKLLLLLTVAFCAVMIVLLCFVSISFTDDNMDSFSEPYLTLSDGWRLTDSAGVSKSVSLPLTIEYGADGAYTLSRELPEDGGLVASPALRFYSNYVDVSARLDGERLYAYPSSPSDFPGITGNTYHFIRLPTGYGGQTLTVELKCQLGDRITYLLQPPLLGSKATMLRVDIMRSLPAILLAGCMLVLALGLTVLQCSLRRRIELISATSYTALFSALFAVYVFCETSFAQLLLPNGYALCSCTLMLLSLLPIPLMGLFADDVSARFKAVPVCLMILCSVNFAAQTILNFTGALPFRVTLPSTHAVIIVSMAVMAVSLIMSDRREKPGARRKLLTALPMIAGGLADILLLKIEKPSFNNSLWFTLGVTVFIVIQFCGFIRGFFVLYRESLETKLLRDMAYRDELTGIGNRNAYERRLKELSGGPLSGALCCIVLDINDLKRINDRLGHQAGDAAIVETGRLLKELVPEGASCFRTGGDEFVVLMEDFTETGARELAESLARLALERGGACRIPLSLAVGVGSYEAGDGNLIDFIRRVDTLMYTRKRELKNAPEYPPTLSPEFK